MIFSKLINITPINLREKLIWNIEKYKSIKKFCSNQCFKCIKYKFSCKSHKKLHKNPETCEIGPNGEEGAQNLVLVFYVVVGKGGVGKGSVKWEILTKSDL